MVGGIFCCNSVYFKLPEGFILECIIWDTHAHYETRKVNKEFLPQAHGCMVVYDITRLKSFNAIKIYCKPEILEKCKKDIKVMLVANKSDLFFEQEVDEKKGLEFAEENNYLFKTTSCLDLDSVVEAFETLILETFNNIKNKDDLL